MTTGIQLFSHMQPIKRCLVYFFLMGYKHLYNRIKIEQDNKIKGQM